MASNIFAGPCGWADPERVQFLLALAETQLDSVHEQAAHLTKVFADPGVHSRV